ncbi:MAG: hypothetical protein COA70_13545 [Planctomycetota bacterium]|nr:MAG: hypothetical protein COA70_13545 [Planctomycetota bacterium]
MIHLGCSDTTAFDSRLGANDFHPRPPAPYLIKASQTHFHKESNMKLKACLSFLFLVLALGACSGDSAEATEENAEEMVEELDY